jgi:hypothetical protein
VFVNAHYNPHPKSLSLRARDFHPSPSWRRAGDEGKNDFNLYFANTLSELWLPIIRNSI